MKLFNLPDLGEGLPDAEIHEWFVKEGDTVTVDQPLVSMETAKAVVDVPCPEAGVIGKLFGKPGDVIKTGAPLVGFEAEAQKIDKGTVVGHLEESSDLSQDDFIIGSSSQSKRIKATPALRLLAKKLEVDLQSVQATGPNGMLTRDDIEKAASKSATPLTEGFVPLKGVKRAMLHSMSQAHSEVVPVSIFDDADIECWSENNDITVRLIKALLAAAKKEPALNAWFNTKEAAVKSFEAVHIGLAMDTADGLFVPVIHDAETKTDAELRQIIDGYKVSVNARTVPAQQLKGATITLSNFGKFAGRYASPIIVPPTVAILAIGRLYSGAVVHNGNLAAHRMLPLSLSFDHRAVTGGEATRFLGAVIEALEQPE